MITLYELHWSHYCEKVRLALDYKGLPWRAVAVDAFNREEIRQLGVRERHAFPTIHDAGTGAIVVESSPILRYLDEHHPDTPPLFPGDAANREAVYRQLIEFDTQLAVPARRLGYAQVILETPGTLTDLFMPRRDALRRGWARTLVGHGLGLLLTKRFLFHRNESGGLYEALEHYLLQLAERLREREFVVGDAFSAADLALAAQIRPLNIVPFFAEHPALQALFERHRRVIARWGSEPRLAYEDAIEAARRLRPPVRRRLRQRPGSLPFAAETASDRAYNDQQPVWTPGLVLYPWHYWVSLRRNKLRARDASATYR